ncbi:MAG: TRAP transporter small permease [Clostridiales bacterium]|nr:TRAP transporter small permease [Clostridiales bacterium]
MKKVNKILYAIGSIFFILMLLIMVVQIVARSTKISISWTEEAGRLCFMYVVFIGAAIATNNSSHLAIDTILAKTSGVGRKIFEMGIELVCLAVQVVFLIGSFSMLKISVAKSYATLPVSMGWKYAAPFISFGLSAIFTVFRMFRLLLGRDSAAGEEGKAL